MHMRDAKSVVMLLAACSSTDPLETVKDLENTVSHIEQGLHRPKEDINVGSVRPATACTVYTIYAQLTLWAMKCDITFIYGYLILCISLIHSVSKIIQEKQFCNT